ncbi:MAG TPA: AMP-binding protein [Methanoregulaceae archaeon]|nr:AMP-binding protein [Methanoregulaceae archaeon]
MSNITVFLDNIAISRDRPALIAPSEGLELTYGEILSRISRTALVLTDQGVGKGDRVCIYLDSCPEHLISYFAIWRIGAVAVPANISLKEDEIGYVIRDSGARILIHDNSGASVAMGALTRGDLACRGLNLDQLSASILDTGIYPPVNCSFDDLCQIQYTAGTTGNPKGAMLTQGNWLTSLETEREVLALHENDRYLGIYPMGHVGVSWGLSVLRAGGTYVIMKRFNLPEYLDLCRKYRISVLSGMPPVIHSLCSAPEGTEETLKTVRVIISGGGQLLPTIWEAFDQRYKIPVANAYGLSETVVVGTGTITLPGRPELTGNYLSVGVPTGYSEVKIVDPADHHLSLACGENGEIALRGPSVAKGYWNLPGPTTESFLPEGWFLTGDIGHVDTKGLLYITDRKKDMIIMSGWKIYPTEVENVLLKHPAVLDAAVFGCPDERRGEIPVAVIVQKEKGSPDPDDLLSFCRERLAGYKVPRGIIVTESLPRVHGWKLLRRRLREEYSEFLSSEDLS